MAERSDAVLFLEHKDEEPTSLSFGEGEVVAFSTSAPLKETNQDAAAVLFYPGGGVIAVADGMGGQSAGERAARITLETLSVGAVLGRDRGDSLREVVLDAIEAANRAVLNLGVGAGTTLAALIVRAGRARPIHVGDSMVLHVGQRGRIKTQTVSHSPTGYGVEAGLLDEDEALHHEERHLISNYVGKEGMHIEIGSSVPIARRDTLLVASDGLADNLTVDEIVEIVRKGPLLQAGRELSSLARERMATKRAEFPSKPDDLTFLLYRRNL